MESNSEDLFIKPGNQERGWNDPPQFSYGLQTTRTPHRNLLTRRAPPTGSGTPPMAPPSSGQTPPRNTVAPPPFSPVPPPPIGSSVATPPPPIGSSVATPPPPSAAPLPGSGPVRAAQSDPVQSDAEPEVEEVMSVLTRALEACRGHSSVQVCNDVGKRLKVLEDGWRSGRLCGAVKRRMRSLTQDLKSGLWDSADETHRSLMVDHVTEVSQWMVGVKRLIAETRNLSPDQLRPLRDQDQDQLRPLTDQDQDQLRPRTDQDQDQLRPLTDQDQDQDQLRPLTDQDPDLPQEQVPEEARGQ